MPELTPRDVAEACGGRIVGDAAARASRVVADSRTVARGEAFWAIRSGHDHVQESFASGASFAVVERDDVVPAGRTAVVVDDSVAALAPVASAVRRRMDVRVVAITGSTGKTTTKDFTAAACGASGAVHASPGSYNNEIGAPLVVLSAPADTRTLVVELGARHTGEIGELCRVVRPDVGVVTGIGVTHIEEFGSRDAIARTKAELVASLPASGLAVLPSGDDYLDVLVDATPARVSTVGPGGHVRVLATSMDERGRCSATVAVGEAVVDVALPVAGRALVRNAAMAIRAAVEVGVDPSRAAAAIGAGATSAWRMEVLDVGSRTVVNDAYNANPTSVPAALRAVEEMFASRERWAVLGVMAELGDAADAEHRRVGRLASALGFDRVVVVGEDAGAIAEGAGDVAVRVADASAAARVVAAEAPPDAVVLVKGSRVAGLERLPDLLAAAPGRPT